MKRRRIPLFVLIFLPVFLVVLVGETAVFLGGYFSLRNSASQNALDEDRSALFSIDETFGEGDYGLLGYALPPVIQTYERNRPDHYLVPGSEEENTYREAVNRSVFSQLYSATQQRLERYITTCVGLYYEDSANDTMVLVCVPDRDASEVALNAARYVGHYVPRDSIFNQESFYGVTLHDSQLGDMFTSATFLASIWPMTGEGGPYRIWAVRETYPSVVYADLPQFTIQFTIVIGITLFLLLALVIFLYFLVLLRPMQRLSNAGKEYVASLEEGNPKEAFALSKGHVSNALTDVNDAFFYAQEAIADYAQKVRLSTSYEERINAELALAERIQTSMVPARTLRGERFSLAGYMRPAKEVGGDLYNYFKIDEDHVGFFIGDVSGKGVPAALFMAKANTALRLCMKDIDVIQANRILCENNNENFFVTAFLALLDLKTGKLRYVNCGHEPVFLCHDHVYAPLEEDSNLPLGCLDDLEFIVQERTLEEGDRLFLYTDGVSEAMDPDGALFGKDRILSCLNDGSMLPNEELFSLMRGRIAQFARGAEQSDDACMVGFTFGRVDTFVFEPNEEGLAKLPDFVDSFLGMGPKASVIQVVLDELCSNVVFYGKSEEPVRVTMRMKGDELTVILVDHGVPFNPLEAVVTKEEGEPGGFGIGIAKSMTNHIEYRFIDGRNVLIFTKDMAE